MYNYLDLNVGGVLYTTSVETLLKVSKENRTVYNLHPKPKSKENFSH